MRNEVGQMVSGYFVELSKKDAKLCPECGCEMSFHAGISRPEFYSCDQHGWFINKNGQMVEFK